MKRIDVSTSFELLSPCCGGGHGDDSISCVNCADDHDHHDHDHHHHDHDHHHHGHDHAHDHEHPMPVVTFENEDGTTEDYPIVDEFDHNGNTYLLVMNSDETVTPLRVEGEEGELVFLDENEFEEVSKAYALLGESEE